MRLEFDSNYSLKKKHGEGMNETFPNKCQPTNLFIENGKRQTDNKTMSNG